jgi:hypothetical protein
VFFYFELHLQKKELQSKSMVVKEFTGNNLPSLEQLHNMIQDGNLSFIDKLMYFGKIIPGTVSYWRSKKAELYSWINHHVEMGRGAPSIFLTLSCADYFWPDIKRLLEDFLRETTKRKVDLNNNFRLLNQVLNDFSLIVFFTKELNCSLNTLGRRFLEFYTFGLV